MLQKPRIIALMQIDAVKAGPHAVSPARMMLMQRPSQRSRSHQSHNQPSQPDPLLHQHEPRHQHKNNRQRPTLREVKPIQSHRKQHGANQSLLYMRRLPAEEQHRHRDGQETVRVPFIHQDVGHIREERRYRKRYQTSATRLSSLRHPERGSAATRGKSPVRSAAAAEAS